MDQQHEGGKPHRKPYAGNKAEKKQKEKQKKARDGSVQKNHKNPKVSNFFLTVG